MRALLGGHFWGWWIDGEGNELFNEIAIGRIKNTDFPFEPRSGDLRFLGMECDGENRSFVPFQGRGAFAAGHVP